MSNLAAGRRYDNFASALRFALQQERKTLYTSMPGIVTSYDAEAQTVNVRGALDVLTTEGGRIQRAEILDVPLVYPQGGGYSIRWPLAEGDNVILLFSMRGLEYWKTVRARSRPGSGILDELDALAVPGLNPAAAGDGPTDKLVVDGEARIEIVAPQIELTGTLTNNGAAISGGGGGDSVVVGLATAAGDLFYASGPRALARLAAPTAESLLRWTGTSLAWTAQSGLYADTAHTHTNYAASAHTHTGYSASNHAHTGVYAEELHTHTGYAATSHTHTGYAAISHAHTGYAIDSHVHTALYAPLGHNHTAQLPTDATVDSLAYWDYSDGAWETRPVSGPSGFARGNHTHSTYATTAHTHDYTGDFSALTHTHTGFAAATHSHPAPDLSGYALVGHTHPGASGTTLPADPGADSLLLWDDSESAVAWRAANHYAAAAHTHSYALPSHLHEGRYSAITHGHVGLAASNHTHPSPFPADPNAASILRWNDSDNAVEWLAQTSFASSTHAHTTYALTAHTHAALYAALGHTHTAQLPTDASADSIAYWDADNDNGDGTTGAWETRPVSGPSGFARGNHLHDARYATTAHTHAALYAALAHTHTAELPADPGADSLLLWDDSESGVAWRAANHYALSAHTHNYALPTHGHTGYAAAGHTHTAELPARPSADALLFYDHSETSLFWLATSTYAAAAHTHDYTSTFAALSHTHSYAATTHVHDSRYALVAHTHTGGGGTTLPADPNADSLLLWDDSESGVAWKAVADFAAAVHTHTAELPAAPPQDRALLYDVSETAVVWGRINNAMIEPGTIATGRLANGAVTAAKLAETYALSTHTHSGGGTTLPTTPADYDGLLAIRSGDDENNPGQLSWLAQTAFATAGHNHDAAYANIVHSHTGHAAATHSHSAAAISLTPPSADSLLFYDHSDTASEWRAASDFALAAHAHTGYATAAHNHAGVYSQAGHAHTLAGWLRPTPDPTSNQIVRFNATSNAYELQPEANYLGGSTTTDPQLPTTATVDSLAFWDASDSAWETRPVAGANGFARGNHLHDSRYARTSHSHSYAGVSHTHSTLYAPIVHTHVAGNLPDAPSQNSLLVYDTGDSELAWVQSLPSSYLADNAVITAKIQDDAVTAAKLAESYSLTTHTHAGSGLPADPDADSLLLWDDSESGVAWRAADHYALSAHTHTAQLPTDATVDSLAYWDESDGRWETRPVSGPSGFARGNHTHAGGGLPADPNFNGLLRWNDGSGSVEWTQEGNFSPSNHNHDASYAAAAHTHTAELPALPTGTQTKYLLSHDDSDDTTAWQNDGLYSRSDHQHAHQNPTYTHRGSLIWGSFNAGESGSGTYSTFPPPTVSGDHYLANTSAGALAWKLGTPVVHETGIWTIGRWWDQEEWWGTEDLTIDENSVELTDQVNVYRNIIVRNAGGVTSADTFRELRTFWPVTVIICEGIQLEQSLHINADGRSGLDGGWPRDGVSGDGGAAGWLRIGISVQAQISGHPGLHGSMQCGGGGGGGGAVDNTSQTVEDYQAGAGENAYALAGSAERTALTRALFQTPGAFLDWGGGHGGDGGQYFVEDLKRGGVGGGVVIVVCSEPPVREAGTTRWKLRISADGTAGQAAANGYGAGGGGGGGHVVVFWGSEHNSQEVEVSTSANGGSGGASHRQGSTVTGGAGGDGGNGWIWTRTGPNFFGIPGSL